MPPTNLDRTGEQLGPSADGFPGVFAERYRVTAVFKRGNGVDTLRAVDLRTGADVVLKTFDLASVRSSSRARFVHETKVLGTLTGLGAGRLHDAGETSEQLYIAQQLVPGETLETALDRGPLPVPVTLQVGISIANALEVAHAASVLHRDVKPANIIVDRSDTAGVRAATLIDFGFARSPGLDEAIRDEFVGTVRYLAPESAGLLPVLPDGRADLYALGIVLYECLAGMPPFTGGTVSELLRQHLSTPAPALRARRHDVPRALAAAVSRLLRKDPAERYQSASALAADLEQIRAAMENGDPDPSVVIGRNDRRDCLTDPAFIGRERELASLDAFVAGLADGNGGLMLIDADSGGGKSRLLGEVTDHAREAAVTVLHGQGIALAGQRPFTLLHEVAAELVRLYRDEPIGRDRLVELTRDVAPVIVRALPALSALLGTDTGVDTGPERFGELRSLAGLSQLLGALGSADRPVLLILDDCQWADTLTLRLLAGLVGPDSEPLRHLGVIAAFRSEEVAAEHPLRQIAGARIEHLGPLSSGAVALLAESMAGPLPADAVDAVIRLADGNPFMAAAVLRGFVEADVLTPGVEGWSVDPARLREAQAARRSAAFLVQRLELLTPEALQLLSVGAVLGKRFDIALAVEIAGRPENAAAILEDGRRRRLLWVDEDSGSCTFFHDKIRESLLQRLPEPERRVLHGCAAERLSASGLPADDLVFDLAYHLTEADRPTAALPFDLAAAVLARSRYALDSAATHFRMAATAAPDADVGSRVRAAEGLGDVLMLQGTYGEAEQQLLAARRLVTEPLHAADLDAKLGALAFKQGDIITAKSHLEGALSRLGRRIPRRTALLIALCWELLVQLAHTVLPRLTTGRRDPAGHEADFLAMRIHSRLAYLHWFHSGKVPCAWAHLRGLNLAERFPASAELGQAWSEHAPALTMLPYYRRAVRYAQRSLTIRQDLDDVWGQGQSLNFTGVAQYAASDFVVAQHACEEAIRLLRLTGDQWEVNTASWTLAACFLRQGELSRAVEITKETYRAAMSIGDRTAAGISLSVWARANGGRVPANLIADQLDHGGEDAQTTAELHLAHALGLRADGDLDGAALAVGRAAAAVHDAGLRQEFIAPVFAWRATILRELAEATSQRDPHLRATRLRAAARATRTARAWAFSYRNNAPHALRESAQIAALRGRPRRAARLLARSLAVAEAQGARYEAALTRLLQSELASLHASDAGAGDEMLAAVRAFEVTEPTPGDPEQAATISLFDRFATLLHVGRAITAATSPATLEAAVRESAVSLLRAERCHLTPLAALSDERPTTQSGERLDGVSRSLLLRAVEQGEPVVAFDDSADYNESLVLSGIRSALAAPIFVDGRVVACLYVTHGQLGELFGDDETQLAAFIATLAGAAYEHLAGSETRFRSLVQSSSDVITLVDADGVVTYQSAGAHRVFGLAAPALLGMPVTTWVHEDDLEAFCGALASRSPEPDSRIECRFRHADGSYRFAETTVTNLLDEPTVSALVLNTRDVTERMSAQEQLREKNHELEKLGRAKDTFLASMSHELRTPLNAIIGFTGTLLMRLPGPLNPDQERQLKTVERSGKHLLAIINDLLDVVKMESGEMSLPLEDVACSEVIDAVVATLRPLAEERLLTLSVRLPLDEVVVVAEERALGQILINLVSNAIKFTESGGVEVRLEHDPDTGTSRISVADTGAGIPEDDKVRIFDAFDRGQDGVRRSQEGTGLGLHICRKLAELVGARIGLVSELGRGSTFTVEFAPSVDGEVVA